MGVFWVLLIVVGVCGCGGVFWVGGSWCCWDVVFELRLGVY